MKLRDHSIKAYRSNSDIEKYSRQDAVRAEIVRAGFPDELVDNLLQEIIFHARWYRGEVDTPETRPRPREVRESLCAVLSTGDVFMKALKYLSNPTRVAIMDADCFPHPDEAKADSVQLVQDVRHLLSCTRVVLLQTPRDKGAKREETAHINFAFRLAIIWHRHFHDSGVKKNGTKGTFRGPLLDFAWQILKLEGAAYRNGVAFRTRLALGKSLHKYRARAADLAAKQAS